MQALPGRMKAIRSLVLGLSASALAPACGASQAPPSTSPATPVAVASVPVTTPTSSPKPRVSAPPLAGGGNRVLVEEIGEASLFAEEDSAVRAAVSKWLAANTPWTVVPADEVEAVRARAVAGKDLSTGAACGAPVHPHTGYERAFGVYDAADVSVDCSDGGKKDRPSLPCTLEVSVRRHRPGLTSEDKDFYESGTSFAFRAPIEGSPTASNIDAAVTKLARVTIAEDAMGGLLGALMGGTIRKRDEVQATLWPSSDPSEPEPELDADAVLGPAKTALDRCFSSVSHQEMYLLSTDDAGRVTRCEGRPWEPVPARACVCAAMKRAAWPKAPRRVAFDVVSYAKDTEVAPGRVVRAWLERNTGALASAKLDVCFAKDAPPAGKQRRVPVKLEIGDDLRPARVRLDWPEGFAKPKTRSCVERVLRSVVFSCHQRGTTYTDEMAVHVSVMQSGDAKASKETR